LRAITIASVTAGLTCAPETGPNANATNTSTKPNARATPTMPLPGPAGVPAPTAPAMPETAAPTARKTRRNVVRNSATYLREDMRTSGG